MQGQVISVGLVVGMCITLAAFTAIAGDDSDRKKMGRTVDIEQMKAGAAERLAKLDADGDGKVTPEEFAAAQMDRGEARGEGKRWREARERRAKAMRKRMREGMRERRGEMRRDRREMLSGPVFDAADGDGDGKLSKEEFGQLPQAARSVAQRRAFDRLDGDGDGVLTASEISPRIAMLEKMDADGDGKVGREEMRAWRKEQASGDGKKKRGWRKGRKSDGADADKTE